jgi:MFS family permease
VVILLFAGVVINYIDRGNLSVVAVPLMRDLGIAPAGMGMLLSAFFWTYALCQIPAGYLTDRFGMKRMYAAGFLTWSLASAATGFPSGFGEVLALRMLLGVGEAVAIPAGMSYVRQRFRPEEQGFPTALFGSGAMVGPALGVFLGAFLLDRTGWRPIFVLTGIGGCLWFLPWARFAPKGRIATAGAPNRPAGSAFPWRALFRLRLTWAMTLGVFCYQYGFYFCLTWLPSYLVMARGFSFLNMGKFTGLPLLAMAAVSMLSGRLSDAAIARHGRPLLVRKLFAGGGLLLATSLASLLLIESNAAVLCALVAAFIGIGFAGPNYWAIAQLVSPEPVIGRVVGYVNTIGNIAGVCAPLVTGFLVGSSGNFHASLLCAGGAMLIGSLMFLAGVRERDTDALRNSETRATAPCYDPVVTP